MTSHSINNVSHIKTNQYPFFFIFPDLVNQNDLTPHSDYTYHVLSPQSFAQTILYHYLNNGMHSSSLIDPTFRLAMHSHNYSLTQALCRANLFSENSDVNQLLKDLRDSLSRSTEMNPHFLDWLNIFLFNVCAINQQLIAEYDNQLLESTESAPKTFVKGKQITQYNQVLAVKNKLKKWLETVLAFPVFTALLSQANLQTISREKSARQLLQTIDYLISKYQLNIRMSPKITEILHTNSQSSLLSQLQPIFAGVNKKLFCSGERFASLMNEISQNYQIDVQSIAKLVSINFAEVSPPRQIFSSAETTGRSFVEECVDFIIRKVPKVDLFSEKMESFRPYELLIGVLFQREASAILQWNSMVIELIDPIQKGFYIHKRDTVIQKLATFMTIYIPTDYPCLHYILKYVYSSLLAKYSTNDSIELMKKLVLNRLLLNPSFFAVLMAPNEEEMRQYVSSANSLRVLFYEKKTSTLMQQERDPRILESSNLLINSLKNMLSAKQSKKTGLNIRDRGVYVNDKILAKIYGQLSDGILRSGNKLDSNSKSNQSYRSEVSLSFSLKNESKSKPAVQSPRVQSNSSVPQVPKPTNRTNVTPKHDTSNNLSHIRGTQSHLRQRGHSQPVELSDMDKLEELVNLRRQYGELRRDIDGRGAQKRQKRTRRQRGLWLLHQGSCERRKQLSGTTNKVMINSTIF